MKASSESGECASLISTVCSPALSVAGVAVMAGRASFAVRMVTRQQELRDASPFAKTAWREETQRWELAWRKAKSRSMLAGRRLAQPAAPGKLPDCYGLNTES